MPSRRGPQLRANLVGGLALATDPAVDSAGVDTGYAADAYTLRAPDLAVGNVPDAPGWVKGAPPLAVEYADTGQDELDLPVKIRELLSAGTRLVWVVRLYRAPPGGGPPRGYARPEYGSQGSCWRGPGREATPCQSQAPVPAEAAAATCGSAQDAVGAVRDLAAAVHGHRD